MSSFPLLETHPYPFLFVTCVGSRAFGYASDTSDYDLHGIHLTPLFRLLAFHAPKETITVRQEHPAMECTTHDLKKFLSLLLRGNGAMLEDLYSPHVIVSTPWHTELKERAYGCITKRCGTYYLRVANTEHQHHPRSNEIKRMLHAYRCLLMGLHLMKSTQIVMDVAALARHYHQEQVMGLIAAKRQGGVLIEAAEKKQHQEKVEQLAALLETAQAESRLPDYAKNEREIEAFLLAVRRAEHI